jgi:hypothetical protein
MTTENYIKSHLCKFGHDKKEGESIMTFGGNQFLILKPGATASLPGSKGKYKKMTSKVIKKEKMLDTVELVMSKLDNDAKPTSSLPAAAAHISITTTALPPVPFPDPLSPYLREVSIKDIQKVQKLFSSTQKIVADSLHGLVKIENFRRLRILKQDEDQRSAWLDDQVCVAYTTLQTCISLPSFIVYHILANR